MAAPDGDPVRARVRDARIDVPAGVTAGVAVFDRQTGGFTEQLNTRTQFRSASVVKLLIALDYLWNRGPTYEIPAADRTRLDAMLRSSDDDAASYYWNLNGKGTIVDRMVTRLGLTDTAPPPASTPTTWGYTALSAADTVKIYRYLLDQAPAPVRDFVMGNLRQSTRCGTDGFDQRFGIPGAFNGPWAVKQGWSGFGSGSDCLNGEPSGTGGTGATAADAATRPSAASSGTDAPSARGRAGVTDVDTRRRALHTTGTVGTGDRYIVAVFSLHGTDTTFGKAYTDLGRLTRSLNLPGIGRPAGTWFETWGTGVRVRSGTTTDSTVLTHLPAGVEVLVGCQKEGQEVTVPPYTNRWWAYLPQYHGYISNIYFRSPDNELPGVGLC
ncbi:hypothetical protein [Streptomyces sp. NPDC003077]|uniref:hypothetical protein n=1 Tax=Streptomyces sp. NPDC003077 TaxID=3154443 RepID=UPI00339E237A